jgi:aspartate 4-decarboxylase
MEPVTPEEARRHSEPSPLQLKDELVDWGRRFATGDAAARKFLDAGRGNPNWVATTPRESFFLLGQFALEESKRAWDEPDIGGMPATAGAAGRLRAFLARADGPGAVLLRRTLDYGVKDLGFEPDAFVHELCDALIGDNYPFPDRILRHVEPILRRYLSMTICDNMPPFGQFELFAVEGGTAAMGYVFTALLANGVLKRGDTIALGTPMFTPYLELPRLRELDFRVVEVKQAEMRGADHGWQYPDAEIAKLEDPKVKAFFVANPGNPGSCAMRAETLARIVGLVRDKRPELLILTDDVYGTFVNGFRSLAAELPHNTILVYSFSKYFGCTGWRLGVVGVHEQSVVDRIIARLPEAERAALRRRYASRTLAPDELKFIDRLVAESRAVALNHTAGLSAPQQVQMALFALFALLDDANRYRDRTREILHDRFAKLFEGLGVPVGEDPLRVGYYATLDLAAWGKAALGDGFAAYAAAHHDPLEIVMALARRHGTVLLSGSSFAGPPWAARVSLANLDADDYLEIGRDLREIAARAVAAWRKAGSPTVGPTRVR